MLAQKSGRIILDQAAFDLTMDSTQTQVMAGSSLGPYRIEALLGQGGTGQVFRFHHASQPLLCFCRPPQRGYIHRIDHAGQGWNRTGV